MEEEKLKNRKKIKKYVVAGFLIGALFIFFLPIFPVPMKNQQNLFSGFKLFSGLMHILVLNIKAFLSLETLYGTVFGFIAFLIYGGIN